MNLREVTLEDAPFVRKLLGQLGYPELDENEVREKIQLHLQDTYRMLVATEESKVIGFMTLHWTEVPHRKGRVGRVTAMCTDESVRSTGVGQKMLAEAEKLLLSKGCSTIEVTSNKRRDRAHAFYKKQGYEETSLRFVKTFR